MRRDSSQQVLLLLLLIRFIGVPATHHSRRCPPLLADVSLRQLDGQARQWRVHVLEAALALQRQQT